MGGNEYVGDSIIMMFLVDLAAGAAIAALAGMGVGGGGLLVLYLVFVKGMGQTNSQGINLVFFVFASVSALFIHLKKRSIDVKKTVKLMCFGGLGAVAGGLVASFFEQNTVRKMFGWFLIISGLLGIFKKRKEKNKKGVDKTKLL